MSSFATVHSSLLARDLSKSSALPSFLSRRYRRFFLDVTIPRSVRSANARPESSRRFPRRPVILLPIGESCPRPRRHPSSNRRRRAPVCARPIPLHLTRRHLCMLVLPHCIVPVPSLPPRIRRSSGNHAWDRSSARLRIRAHNCSSQSTYFPLSSCNAR